MEYIQDIDGFIKVIGIIKGIITIIETIKIFIMLVGVIHNVLLRSELYTSYYTYITYTYIQPIIGYIQAINGFTIIVRFIERFIKMMEILDKFIKMYENINGFIGN